MPRYEERLFTGATFGVCDQDDKRKKIERTKYSRRTHNPRYDCYKWHQYTKDTLARRVRNAKQEIDNKEPLIPAPTSFGDFNRRVEKELRAEGENAILLKRIQQQYSRKPHPMDKPKPAALEYVSNKGLQRGIDMFKTISDNIKIYKRLQNVKPLMSRKEQLNFFEKHQACMRRMSNFPLWYESRLCAPREVEAQKRALRSGSGRDHVYLDIEVQDEIAGRIVIELFSDVTPMAAENFRCLCLGIKKQSYKCVAFDKVIPDILWRAQTTGIKSIYGLPFPPENFKMKHDKEGLISMPTFEKRGIGSEFMITLRPLQCLDGENLVVGQIVHGLEFIKKASGVCEPVKAYNGTPCIPVMVTKCGEVEDLAKATSSRPMLIREILEEARRPKAENKGENGEGPAQELADGKG